MIDLKDTIAFWKNHLDLKQNQLTDHQCTIIKNTITYLCQLRNLQEQVNVKLNLGSDNPTRKP